MSPRLAVTATPSSVTATPIACIGVIFVRNTRKAPISTKTGIAPCKMPILIALVE